MIGNLIPDGLSCLLFLFERWSRKTRRNRKSMKQDAMWREWRIVQGQAFQWLRKSRKTHKRNPTLRMKWKIQRRTAEKMA